MNCGNEGKEPVEGNGFQGEALRLIIPDSSAALRE